MLKYINETDYEKYMELSNADSIPDGFTSLVIEASTYIKTHTTGAINDDSPCEDVKYVTCLIVNLLNNKRKELSNSNLKSENVGNWSRTYSTQEEIAKSYEQNMQNTLYNYLGRVTGTNGLPLMYMGVI